MKPQLLLATIIALHFSPYAAAQAGPACAAKQASIESKVVAAQARGNKWELAGLNRALQATKANCTDESLVKEREKGIRKAKQELAKREKELAQAEKTADPEKIAKRRAKAEKARGKLAESERPLVE